MYVKALSKIKFLAVLCYVRYQLSFCSVEDSLHECGIDICHGTVQFWAGRLAQSLLRKFERTGWVNTQTGSGI